MILFLVLLLVVSISYNLFQFYKRKQYDQNLSYIHQKLNRIIDEKSAEKLLLHTENENLRVILIEINRILEHNQKMIADYNRTEMSMRRMLSNISHDLKTPLTVVLGYIGILLNDSEENQEELRKMYNKTMEVLALINRFFDLAKLESGDRDIPLAKVNMNEFCKKHILGFYEVLTTKGFEVEIDIPDNSLFALSNEEALERVINNLISNAIQYGGEGKYLGMKLYQNERYIFLDVSDKGKGISALHQNLVFERMYTLEDSRNKSYQGSGLGLTITKRLIEKMNGEILLNSKPYEQTTFTIKLPQVNY